LASAFKKFIERKWQDALNIAAAEPPSWGMEKEKIGSGRGVQDKAIYASKGAPRMAGAVNVVEQETIPRSQSPSWDVSFGRKCRARYLIGCDVDHVLLQCNKLLGMELDERKEILKKSGLCLFCLKHAVEVECYGQGSFSKPKCTQAGCNGEHTPGVHKLLGKDSAGVNLVAEGEYESVEDEEWWVGTIRIEGMGEEEEEALRKAGEPEPEGGTRCGPSGFTMENDSGLEDEGGYLWGAHTPPVPDESEEDGWWSPELPEPGFEEDEEGVCYPAEILEFEHRGDKTKQVESPPPANATPCIKVGDLALPCVVRQGKPPGTPGRRGSPHTEKTRRRKLRKKVTTDRDHEWEVARQDAWLRELLTDSSESESEEKYARFAESERWIAEMTGVPQQARRPQEGSVLDRRSRSLEVVIVRRLVTWVLGIWRGEEWERG
jgi:hypothetical protein